MSGPKRAFGSARRWAPLAVLLALVLGAAGSAWVRAERARAVAAWKATAESRGMRLRIGSTAASPFGVVSLHHVELDVSPAVRVRVARVELGRWPWQRESRAHEVTLRLSGPIDTVVEQVRGLAWPSDVKAGGVRVEYAEAAFGKLTAENVTYEPSGESDQVHAESVHVLGTTFRDVNAWVRRQNSVVEIRLAQDADDAKAPKLRLVQSPGEGVEWNLDIPTRAFTGWASRIGLTTDETWEKAVVVGTGSLVLPESPAFPARAFLRFTVDGWHRPDWPDAALLTGRSGALALRITPGPGPTHRVSRVEVEAGLFSLVGSGQLSFGHPNRLTFEAYGERSCVRLLEHLPASSTRDRVSAYLSEHPGDAQKDASVRLELLVRAEAPRGTPLRFRWHLHAGCGLPELKEEPMGMDSGR